MAMIELSYRMREGRFSLCAFTKMAKTRNYRIVSGLESPDFELWDSEKQLFLGNSREAKHNNQVLQEMREHYENLIKMFDPKSGKELFKMADTKIEHVAEMQSKKPPRKTNEITFGGFIQEIIDNCKASTTRNPTKNYQLYISLLHKLELEGQIVHKPLSKICNRDFIAFGDFLLYKMAKTTRGTNYIKMMQRFKTVHGMAFNRELNNNVLRYQYRKDAPIINTEERFCLDLDQYKEFVEYDLSTVDCSLGKNTEFKKEMFRDFCIFMYETKIRPVDVLKLQHSCISNGKIIYIPEKKKNYPDVRKRKAITPLTDTARKIAKRYFGQSKYGYVFPFDVNQRQWDFTDSKSWHTWNSSKNKALADVNKFLKAMEKPLMASGHITTYTFRHSAFTHIINNEQDVNLLRLAKEGATSVKMLEEHYYHLQ